MNSLPFWQYTSRCYQIDLGEWIQQPFSHPYTHCNFNSINQIKWVMSGTLQRDWRQAYKYLDVSCAIYSIRNPLFWLMMLLILLIRMSSTVKINTLCFYSIACDDEKRNYSLVSLASPFFLLDHVAWKCTLVWMLCLLTLKITTRCFFFPYQP